MEDEALVATLRRRGVAGGGIRDFLDLAEAILDADAIQDCLARLDRRTLAALWDGELPDDRLLLTDGAGATLPEVRDQLRRWPDLGLPDPDRLGEPPPDPEPAASAPDPEQVDRLAAEHAFAAATATTRLLFELEREPARLLARGSVGLSETKRLAEALVVDEEHLPVLVDVAERAGLVARHPGLLLPTKEHRVWLGQEVAARWTALAGAWADGLPAGIRGQLARRERFGGAELRRWLAWLYPGGGDRLGERVDDGFAAAELLGVTAGEALSAAGAAVLADDLGLAADLLSSRLPAPVDRVYLQHDLSIVAPGPLAADVDLRMRGMADAESQALASSYRVSTGSVERALGRGETAETILDFLASVSLGPVPQPLRYLIEEAEARYGRLRVARAGTTGRGAAIGPTDAIDVTDAIDATDAATGTRGAATETGRAALAPDAATRIRSDDPALLRTVLVDSALAALALTPASEEEVVSPREPEVVYWALVEARYPVILEDARGAIAAPKRPVARAPREEPADPVAGLVERLRLADPDPAADLETAWLTRQLAAAIRSKSVVTVSVRMPNGSVVDFRLEPASVAGGRLRARDPLSEIERTLPLASIAAVAPE